MVTQCYRIPNSRSFPSSKESRQPSLSCFCDCCRCCDNSEIHPSLQIDDVYDGRDTG